MTSFPEELQVCQQEEGEEQGYLSDHLAPGLRPLSVGGSFPLEGEDSLSGGSILQRELADDPTESRHFNVPNRRGRLTQEQQEGVEPEQEERSVHCSGQHAGIVYLYGTLT